MKKTAANKLSLFDINESSYHHLKGHTPELDLNGTRVSFMFEPDEAFFRLSREYHGNIQVSVLDYVNAQRQLKSMMMAMKTGGRQNG